MREPEGTEALATERSFSQVSPEPATVRIFDTERHGAFHDVVSNTFPLSHVVMPDGAVKVIATVMLSRFRFACYDATGRLVKKGTTATDWP